MSLVIMLGWLGCASSKPTISNASHHKEKHSNEQSHNEVRVDSILIEKLREVIIKGDTTYIHDSIFIEKWRERQVVDSVHDTLYIDRTDTVRVPVEIEKPIAPFVRNSCIALWVIIGVAILALIIWIVWNFATGKFSWHNIVAIIPKLIFGLIRK